MDQNGGETSAALESILRERKERENTYREKALKLFPWICGRCGREFSGKRVKELTVHHKDHNHDNNPADGSNWELLCIYCHENEHARQEVAAASAAETPSSGRAKARPIPGDSPFAGLADLLKKKGGK
jgi:predicted HNH restriction endonuclease